MEFLSTETIRGIPFAVWILLFDEDCSDAAEHIPACLQLIIETYDMN